jgi:2-oxoglutarate dehydrogenase E1 component
MDATGDGDASSAGPAGSRASDGAGAFGPNAWLVEDMYDSFRNDPTSVSESWREFFADYRPASAPVAEPPVIAAPSVSPSPAAATSPTAPRSPAPDAPPAAPPMATAPATAVTSGATTQPATAPPPAAAVPVLESAQPLRGAAGRIVANMEASLGVPTATSVRVVPAKLLEVNRTIVNNQLFRTVGGKVSFTHLIGYAVVRGLMAVPAMNAAFVADADDKGTPGVIRYRHVGLGLAVDVEKSAGQRTLLVPCIKDADAQDFRGFVAAYEELVRKIHTNKIAPDDFAGTTVTLTNPGTLGTVQSVPRLMPGQGLIVGVGALGFPPGFEAADPRTLADLGIGKTVTITSTYDHRIIQGAESGLFLAYVSECLMGGHGFYDEVFESLGIPYEPVRWEKDVNASDDEGDGLHLRLIKQVHVQTLINMYRVRGHLIAHLDPLDAEQPALHPELDPLHYGLTIWDLPRTYVADGLAGKDLATLDEILHTLRDAYCRTLGVEYMHIQDPDQKRWIQEHLEGVPSLLSPDEQRHILSRLNAAEVFERFLHSRYVGQKRFGLEGAESAIVLLDTILDEAVNEGLHEAVMGMSHRGRLNVLANIVGKSYGEIFEEFEGNLDPESVQGSGDVKYHKGASGTFVARNGGTIPVTLASNPSHLEAVDPVVMGMARAKQDALGGEQGSGPHLEEGVGDPFPVLSVLLHGDAAFAGQGVVAETLNLSGLAGYRTGGTVHIVINNQLGFTTAPQAARTSVYPTDVAKMVQAPIFHVNGDDPEACARAARLAFGFRQAFHKDVVIDMVCYRRHGHNEGDDPSYTQPLMYALIEAKRSVRKLYTESLVRRGDISLDEAEQALDDFSARLQSALDETRAEAEAESSDRTPVLPAYVVPDLWIPPVETGVEASVLAGLAQTVRSVPDGFVIHPKLARQFEQRDKVVADGEIDWALGEALAIGSLLLEGTNVRLTGQDTRRGTFSQRHAVLVDHITGREHVPLAGLGGGRFTIRDSLLSEYACVGFEYGYSVEAIDNLVAWEAQFGDFWNGAEIIVDNFLVAAEGKWGQKSGLVLLLPHGYEGQGPEHSSARIERFLTMCARGNLRVADPTTAAQYFHLLRSQVKGEDRRPLIVFTPKSLLRARQARSPIGAFTSGSFAEVLDDPAAGDEDFDADAVTRVVLCTGKVAYDALGRRDELGADGRSVAVVRVEQLYPWPKSTIKGILDRYPKAREVVWLQEEPENMGAWNFVHQRLHRLLRDTHALRHVSRAESASPASGSAALHRLEQDDLLARAVG